MEILLHPVKSVEFDRQYEYEISKEGQLYVAGIKKVKLNSNVKLEARLYLDELFRQSETRMDTILARPIFPSPDYDPIYTLTKERRKDIFSINPVVIDKDFGQFINNIQARLIRQYKSKMNEEDIIYFFRGIHQHYINDKSP